MIDFDNAIKIATEKAKSLVPNSQNLVLEEVMLSDDNKFYEVTLSFDLKGANPLALDSSVAKKNNSNLLKLAELMAYRREYKTFLIVSSTGEFKGFRKFQNK